MRWASVLRVPLHAEDVRTETEALRLAELGITNAQGPYFSEAVTAEEIRAMIAG
jgi:EAL domain-containing protein (putative c-di-GMP-specific phosphodiesterase class I)